ncbi:putative cobalt transporter subunit CbtA [Sulfitobacter noctilucicola]|uniref:Cobalt transporter subunit CbtA n=1 Tax=Sulfitobacter noctilucicola TaxID=1342301 RepID=A0A7W6M4V0_9RHOB|nr:CbtA family protein [Sulfitobacter noctilucicola]KIN63019.1 putative cobalt transporter subunit CbtA [Sulfitobacter noctilucicola]MBB4172454.1 cobalt transporter subunit CbtA [Sulfitobacter noctilucicola]
MYSRFLVSALFAGATAGLIAGILQLIFVQPVLLHAELYESGQLVHFGAEAVTAHPDLPGFDVMRDGLSLIFTMLTYTGYALIMIALMGIAEDRGAVIDGRTGLIWGVAGFVVFHLAPGVSLAPEVPGVAAADVTARQIWWFATVGAAAVALWLVAFGTTWMVWGVAAVLLAAPHLIGAPEPDVLVGPVPTEIGALFAARAFGVGLAAWVLLGSFAGYFWQREGVADTSTASA